MYLNQHEQNFLCPASWTFVFCGPFSMLVFLFIADMVPSSPHSDSREKRHATHFPQTSRSPVSKSGSLFSCTPSDTNVYNALVCDQTLTLELWSHVLHLHPLQFDGALTGVFGPRGGLSAVGLPQAGAALCGVNARVSAAAAALTTVSAAGKTRGEVHLFIHLLTENKYYSDRSTLDIQVENDSSYLLIF